MKVYVARHAETNYNVLGLCNDSPKVNVYLTEKGIKQAELLAESLKDAKFEIIITSEFPRTKETARIVNKFHHAPTIEDVRINDLITGFEGKPVEDFRRARRSAENRWTVRLNGGESFEDEKLRVIAFLKDLKLRPEKCILVVTHQAIARLLYAVVNNLPYEKVNDLEVSNTHSFVLEL
ncbi:MAG: histidine phosphatase family protein [Candidatus Saccharimonadales bacterium]